MEIIKLNILGICKIRIKCEKVTTLQSDQISYQNNLEFLMGGVGKLINMENKNMKVHISVKDGTG